MCSARRMSILSHRVVAVLSFVALSLGLSGCPGGFLSFSLGDDIAEQRVAGSPLGGLLGTAADVPIPLDIDLATETAARDTGPAQHVFLTGLSLAITATAESAGDTDDFDFLDSAEIYVESTASGSALPRRRVASLVPVPDGVRTIAFVPEGVDIIEYVREGARLSSTASGRVPPDDVTFTGRYDLVIEVLP